MEAMTRTQPSTILLRRVTKRYRKGTRLDAVHRIDLSIEKGELVFLTGASGAGKSTILRLISMAEFPSEGEVIVGEHSSATIRRRELSELRRCIGVVFQDFRLWREWTIEENVAAAVRVTGEFNHREIRRRTQAALQQVGLAHRRTDYPSQLSGGEQQRAAIARAIVNRPFVLLADEPTGNLDPDTGASIFRLLREIHFSGTSVILATHDLDLVAQVGGRVIRLEQGRQVEDRLLHASA
jgi:cell division transport system ATP-binding protein